MNPLIKGLVSKFLTDQAVEESDGAAAFERFVIWCALAQSLPPGCSLDDVMTGNETVGIDGLAILANDELVLERDSAQQVANQSRTLDVEFTFIQAKTSDKFERAQLLNFGESVADFFAVAPGLRQSPVIAERRAAKDLLYENSAAFRSRRPLLRLLYATTGTVVDDPNLVSAVESVRQNLNRLGLFEEVRFDLMGATELHRCFNAIENRATATFNFSRRVVLPRISGVREAYVGVVEAEEFMKLIVGHDGQMLASVFYDNVRAYQDLNVVNKGMLATLQDVDEAVLFPVLNNGVTVVAQDATPVGEEMTIADYQIVNGCQTSHVIYAAARDGLPLGMLVPLRLVVTNEDTVASLITKATNTQTPVDESNLQALTDLQKELESYYRGQESQGERLYYERRSRQYSGQRVPTTRVISLLVQMRAFAAFALDKPQLASGHHGKLYEQIPELIFNPSHRLESYHTSALAWYRLDVALRRKQLSAACRADRYLLLTGYKYVALPNETMPSFTSKHMSTYCERLNWTLVDERRSLQVFEAVAATLAELASSGASRDGGGSERLVAELRAAARRRPPAIASGRG